jgi:WD40 repeat protein
LAFSPDGEHLASGGDGQQLRVWRVADGAQQREIVSRPGKIHSLVYCGAGKLACGKSDNFVHVWDLATGSEPARLVGHCGSVSSLSFNAERELLVSGSFDTTVRLWDLARQPLTKPVRQAGVAGSRQ